MTNVPGADPVVSLEATLERIDAETRPGIWIERVDPAVVRARAGEVATAAAAGVDLPLAGRALAVKGNIDVAGIRTTAGCPGFGRVPRASAPVVRALEAAGAVVVGVTNLDQFATGLVGTRSPHGPCPNAHDPELISGGSSSGSAVAVAAGLVDLALGTDTAGSGRVPAAANGVVGFKPTRGWLSTAGVVPACRSLDCVSVFAADVAAAWQATRLAAPPVPDPADPWSRVPPPPPDVGPRTRLGIAAGGGLTFDGDPDGGIRFEEAVRRLVDRAGAAGWAVTAEAVGIQPFVDVGRLLYDGAFVAERYEAVGEFVRDHPGEVEPVVRDIVLAAGRLPAWAAFADRTELRRRLAATRPSWDGMDVLVVPSVPRIPTVAEVDAAPVAVNSMLGTYTNFVNLADLCAVSVPMGHGAAALTLIAPAGHDARLAALGAVVAEPPRGQPAASGVVSR